MPDILGNVPAAMTPVPYSDFTDQNLEATSIGVDYLTYPPGDLQCTAGDNQGKILTVDALELNCQDWSIELMMMTVQYEV